MAQTTKPLRETRFANRRLDPVGVELLTLSELRSRVPQSLLLEPERVDFFMVLVATAGRGKHLVDFERFELNTGGVIFVRPRQVQQWQAPDDLEAAMEADVLLVNPAVMQPNQQASMALLRHEGWPVHFNLDAEAFSAWRSLSGMLRTELERPQLDEVSAAMARELLVCLMLCISRSATGQTIQPSKHSLLVRQFQGELDSVADARPSVDTLARRLGVSTSTLVRACNEVLGHSAKAEVDRRVALEAQRLLVASALTVVEIGELIGFSEPTNFVKFFRRLVGTTPQAFRLAHRLQQAG